MPTKTPQVSFQKPPQPPSTMTKVNEDNPIKNNEQDPNDYPIHPSPPVHQRRLPLPTKLSFEQNITNLIEKESPLLQSELLTAEHELSVFRSRLAVNEGVTAVTGSILESLKEQFQKIDRTTSPLDTYVTNPNQQSSASQTSPSLDSLPDSLEIHYDAESPRSPYFVVKANNSFWLAQPLTASEVQSHFQNFTSPIMKRARIKLPENFDLEDIDKDSISDDDQSAPIARQEQLSEMKTIRSSSLIQQIDQFERFDDKLDEIYSSIDYLKHNQLTPISLNNLQKKIYQLKVIMHDISLTKQDELRLEYEFDELENLFHQTSQYGDYNLMELFEQNLNELQHIIEQIKSQESPRDLVMEFETKLESMTKKSYPRLIPENPIVTKDVFFEGDKISREKKHSPRLIPEDPQINASSFYEGDIHRSFYPHPPEPEKKVLIPEKPLVSSEVFYEGDPQRSMFIKRSIIEPIPASSPVAIDNLREIMSDLMLAASWSKKPPRLDRQSTKDDVEIHAESFITMEEQNTLTPVCEIIHEIENFSIDNHPPVLIEQSALEATSIHEELLNRTSGQIVEQALSRAVADEEDHLYYQLAVQIVNDVIENILLTHDEEGNSIQSSVSSDSGEDEIHSGGYSSADTDEENEQLIPQISDQPYLFVNDVVTSKSTQELGHLVQELQVLEHQIHDIHPLTSSSSSSSSTLSENEQISALNLSIPSIPTTKSVTELTNLVSELQYIEEQLADKLDFPEETTRSPISSKSFNELGGLINELNTVANRIHQELFTANNIDCLSHDIVQYRRDSQPILMDYHSSDKDIDDQSEAVDQMIDQIIKEAQNILRAEAAASNTSHTTVRLIPTIVVDQRRAPSHQTSATSISDDFELSHDDNNIDRTFELEAQLDYLRRMSRYENLMDQYDQSQQKYLHSNRTEDDEQQSEEDHDIQSPPIQQFNQCSTDSLVYHSAEDIDQTQSRLSIDRMKSTVNKPHEIVQDVKHFQSAYDLHDEEKSKLVRSPELYNIDNVIKHDQRSLLTNSQIQHRTLSESALATDDSKRHSLTTSNDASVEFLTTISKENSAESLQQVQRLPTPFDDVLEKESSPEHSESSLPPSASAFSDTFEPTSSSQRPLAFSSLAQQTSISDIEYQTAANDLVNQILRDVINELTNEQDQLSSNDQDTSSDENDELLDEEDQLLINNEQPIAEDLPILKTSARSSFSKILRRAQTDTKHFDIIHSPISLIPPNIRRNSQSDTESYFRAVSPSVHDYTHIDNSSSDENSSPKSGFLFPREHEKYSGEGEDSSGGKERLPQRRKRSSDNTTNYESPSMKTISFKFDTNENLHRQESLDSPLIDSNEKSIFKHLQQGILRTNLESFQIDLKFTNQQKDNLPEKTFTKKSLSNDDYDGGSETDRDDLKNTTISNKSFSSSSIDSNIRHLLDELVDTISENISSSSHSDATTVVWNSNKNSMDYETVNSSSSSSSSSSSHSVIYQQDNNYSIHNANKQISNPSFSHPEFIDSSTKK